MPYSKRHICCHDPSCFRSEVCYPRRPTLSYSLHVVRKLATRNLLAAHAPKGRMLVRVVEGVLQEMHIGVLHGAEHGLELRVAQAGAHAAGASSRAVDAAAAHVDDADHADARVGLEAVRGEAVVDGVQQAEVAREADARDGVVLGAQVENVDGGGEEEGELQRRPDRGEGVGRWVVRGEDGDVEGVVIAADDAQASD